MNVFGRILSTSLLVCVMFSAAMAQAPASSAPQEPAAAPKAAAPKPIKAGPFTISGSWRVRGEAMDWFEGAANDSYGYGHSLFRLNLGIQKKSWGFNAEATVPVLFGAPDDAVAPGAQGQLGFGASYFVANGRRSNYAAIYPSKFNFQLKNLGGVEANKLTVGRFEFIEGTELTPQDKTLAALKTMRIAHRLIGNFGWSANPRNQDGVHLSLKAGSGNVTVAAARPTRGVFQMDGLGELDIVWGYGAWTQPFTSGSHAGELRVFGVGYTDERPVTKTDNRAAAVRSGADRFEEVRVGTFGAHYLHAVKTGAGPIDLLLWGAAQTGSWGLQDHRAGAGSIELGWQPNLPAVKPWLRAAYFMGSGDNNPGDGRHETFFTMLPTPRWYARYPFFNQMNSQDASVSLILRPGTKLQVRSEFHNLALSARNDLWYQGGGAFQPRTFGFTGRPSGGSRKLANYWDISADYTIGPKYAVGLYFANVWGGSVVRSVYPAGENSKFGYAEFTYRF